MNGGQVSIEALMVALIVLMMGTMVVSYYFSIMDSTTAMELLKVATLKKISSMPGQYSIEKIDYAISGSNITLCVQTNPADGFDLLAEEDGVRKTISEATSFAEGSISILVNEACD